MFDEIQFNTIDRLPNYVFAEINEIKLKARRAGEDIIDFSMGNPDGDTPKHIVDKLVETAQKSKNYGYSASKGIYKLRLAMSDWYKRKYDVDLDPETEVVATMGSKEGYVHLVQAITNPGDVAHAFIIAGGNVVKMPFSWNKQYELDEDQFFADLDKAIKESMPRPKFVVVNFPHNPTTVTVEQAFYDKLIAVAKKERFYIISDIAYADITFDGYKTPSILSSKGAKDVAVESYTLSKSYNMAGWRVGFFVGNPKLIGALQKIKSWFDYGMFTPIQVGATVALNGPQECQEEIIEKYRKRRDVVIESFANAGWIIDKPLSSMFVWAKLPPVAEHLGSMEFSKQLLTKAKVAVSPGIGFGEQGEQYVRIALIENEKRIRQAAKNIKKYLKELEEEAKTLS